MYVPALAMRFVGLAEAVREAVPAPDPEAETVLELDAGPLTLDLRDPADLESVYERDIKYGGVQVASLSTPDVDEEVIVFVRLPDPHGTIECQGLVVKCTETPPTVAVRRSIRFAAVCSRSFARPEPGARPAAARRAAMRGRRAASCPAS